MRLATGGKGRESGAFRGHMGPARMLSDVGAEIGGEQMRTVYVTSCHSVEDIAD